MIELLRRREGLYAALLLALLWGLVPALPALFQGQLIGQPYTDLYPAVWGLWGFAQAQPGLPGHTELLGAPGGMGFYYSSPLKGWLAWPLIPLIGLAPTWNLLTVAARIATVMAAWLAGRTWGLKGPGALAVAAIYGASPFFHGYAVEGIVEGTDGWTLALWAAAVGTRRYGTAILLFALTLYSSWYLGMVACLLALLAGLRDRRAWASFLGLALAFPGLWTFAGAFPGAAPLSETVREAMGARLTLPSPGITAGLNPFAINTYVGFVVVVAAIASRSRWALLALLPAALSFGVGPIYDLPVAELVRFPYRWHAATLLLLGAAVGTLADRRGWWWLGPLAMLEGLLLSPVEPILPGAPASIPEIYSQVDSPLLEVPGPVALPPGEINPSRARARYLLYYQTATGQPSPWVPDFNSVGVGSSDGLDGIRAWDRLASKHAPSGLSAEDLSALSKAGVGLVMVERAELGQSRGSALEAALLAVGATRIAQDSERTLFRLVEAEAPAR